MAVGLTSLLGARVSAAQRVLFTGYDFHVVRIDAEVVATQMIDYLVVRDWGLQELVDDPMDSS